MPNKCLETRDTLRSTLLHSYTCTSRERTLAHLPSAKEIFTSLARLRDSTVLRINAVKVTTLFCLTRVRQACSWHNTHICTSQTRHARTRRRLRELTDAAGRYPFNLPDPTFIYTNEAGRPESRCRRRRRRARRRNRLNYDDGRATRNVNPVLSLRSGRISARRPRVRSTLFDIRASTSMHHLAGWVVKHEDACIFALERGRKIF